jgi:hypothetical protein
MPSRSRSAAADWSRKLELCQRELLQRVVVDLGRQADALALLRRQRLPQQPRPRECEVGDLLLARLRQRGEPHEAAGDQRDGEQERQRAKSGGHVHRRRGPNGRGADQHVRDDRQDRHPQRAAGRDVVVYRAEHQHADEADEVRGDDQQRDRDEQRPGRRVGRVAAEGGADGKRAHERGTARRWRRCPRRAGRRPGAGSSRR